MNRLETTCNEIGALVADWLPLLETLPSEIITQRRNSQNRNIKQILGHTIDSATNNIHRIVHLQYRELPLDYPNYATFGNNDRWIAIQDYEHEDWKIMTQLWKFLMLHIIHVIRNIDETKLDAGWIAGPDRLISLELMVKDFPVHLKLHLSEIEELVNGE